MALLTVAEIRKHEKQHADGISSQAIVNIFKKKGERFSEPTLRKYVQLGLLPKSRRVGIRGRHRGSSGLYPVVVVKLINEIKKSLEAGATLDEIRLGKVGLIGELQVLKKAADQVFERFNGAAKLHGQSRTQQQAFKRKVDKHRRALLGEIKELDRFAVKLSS